MTDEAKLVIGPDKIDPLRATDCFMFMEPTGAILVFRRPVFTMSESVIAGTPIVSAAVALPWPIARALHEMLGQQLANQDERAMLAASAPKE